VKIYIHKLLVTLNSSAGNAAKDLGGTTRTAACEEPAFPNTQRKVGSAEVLAEYSKILQRINLTKKTEGEEHTSVSNAPRATL